MAYDSGTEGKTRFLGSARVRPHAGMPPRSSGGNWRLVAWNAPTRPHFDAEVWHTALILVPAPCAYVGWARCADGHGPLACFDSALSQRAMVEVAARKTRLQVDWGAPTTIQSFEVGRPDDRYGRRWICGAPRGQHWLVASSAEPHSLESIRPACVRRWILIFLISTR